MGALLSENQGCNCTPQVIDLDLENVYWGEMHM